MNTMHCITFKCSSKAPHSNPRDQSVGLKDGVPAVKVSISHDPTIQQKRVTRHFEIAGVWKLNANKVGHDRIAGGIDVHNRSLTAVHVVLVRVAYPEMSAWLEMSA